MDIRHRRQKAIYDLARYSYLVDASQAAAVPLIFVHTENFVLVDREGRIRGLLRRHRHGGDPQADRRYRPVAHRKGIGFFRIFCRNPFISFTFARSK